MSGKSDSYLYHFLQFSNSTSCLFSDVLKMGTRRGGIICHVGSIFAMSVLITTTEGETNAG